MGSPYFVHKQANRIHVIRTSIGLERLLPVVCKSMGTSLFAVLREKDGPELSVLCDIFESYNSALISRSRQVMFLEARYEWLGWEKFQRVLVFDFSGEVKSSDRFLINYDWNLGGAYLFTPLEDFPRS